jgi:hypothetical protein
MAKAKGFETLMIKTEAKDKYYAVKKVLEERMGVELTHSQAMIIMCNELLPSSKSNKQGELS